MAAGVGSTSVLESLTLLRDLESPYNIAVDGYHIYRIVLPGRLVPTSSDLPEGMLRISSEKDRDRFVARDGQDARFYIKGVLNSGVLTFEVVAVLGTRTRGQFTGRAFFDSMMDHVGRRRVKIIEACWSAARDQFTTNLVIFNEETRRSAASGAENQEAAAFQTKTGRWARAYNFTAIESIDARPVGLPGGYEQVIVRFVRAPRKKRQA